MPSPTCTRPGGCSSATASPGLKASAWTTTCRPWTPRRWRPRSWTEFDEAIAALKALTDPLSEQIEGNNDPVLTAFTELQDVIVLLKADVTSVLGVTITYQDNDGD